MRELISPTLIKIKAVLFLIVGILATALLLFDRPGLRTAFLLLVAIWSFCRLYYFAFYVVDRYLPEGVPVGSLSDFLRRTMSLRR